MADEEQEIKRMTIKEFREEGYLQEVNRNFLHPLGLALEVDIEEDGSERIIAVWDYRDDKEGMTYAPGVIDSEKAERVAMEANAKFLERTAILGYFVQGIND